LFAARLLRDGVFLEENMKLTRIFLVSGAVALLGLAGLAASTTAASAYIACNHDGDCWHTHTQVRVPGVTFDWHPDSWYFRQRWDSGDRHFREYHEGRGYWRGGVWVTL
jgi:hypothetical protein